MPSFDLGMYTGAARRSVAMSSVTARELGHTTIGTAHLVLGLFPVPKRTGRDNSVAGRVLDAVGLDRDTLQRELIHSSGRGTPLPDTRRLPFSQAFTLALAGASREALESHVDYIGSHHLLLGIARSELEATARAPRRFAFPKRTVPAFSGYDIALSKLEGFPKVEQLRKLVEASAYEDDYHPADPKEIEAARQTDEYKARMARWHAANPPGQSLADE